MKLDEFKKLFKAKRILALALAAAMTVTSMPATASAAEAGTEISAEAEAVEDTSDEGLVPESGEAEGDSQETDESTEVVETKDVEETTEAATEGVAAETTEASTEAAAAETTEAATETDDERADEEQSAEEQISPEADTAVVQFKFDTTKLKKEDTTAVYNRYETPFTLVDEEGTVWPLILSRLYLTYDAKGNGAQLVSEAWDTVTYQWAQKGSNGNYTNLTDGNVPKEVGEYRLTVTLPDVANRYKGDNKEIDFTITQAPVEVVEIVAEAKAGGTKADVKIVSARIKASDGREFLFDADDTTNNEIAFSDIKIKEVYPQNKELEAADKLAKSKDYEIEAAVAFTDKVSAEDKKNYQDPTSKPQKITVGELKETQVQIELTGDTWNGKVTNGFTSDDQPIQFVSNGVYTGKEQDVFPNSSYTAKVGETGTDNEGASTFTVIEGAATTGEWYKTSYFYQYTQPATGDNGVETTKTIYNYGVGDELEGNPVDAGTYIYRVTYNDEKNGIYKKSFADVLVEIRQVKVSVQPVIESNDTGFFHGVSASEVLKKVDYKVYDTETPANDITDKIDKMRFFTDAGWTAYTQPYEPVFEIVRVISDKDGNVMESDVVTTLTSGLTQQNIADECKEVFKVRFKGTVAVYSASGDAQQTKNVTTENTKNYAVVNDYNDKAVEIKMSDSKAAEINIDAIVSTYEGKGYTQIPGAKYGGEDAVVLTKIYDGSPLYASRGDYKKAVVKAGETALASNTDAELIYTLRYSSSTPDAADIEVNGLSSYNYNNISDASGNAGVYKLSVSYQDETKEYRAAAKDVYFVIERQRAKLVPDGEYKALTDTTVQSFLNEYARSGKIMLYGGEGWIDPVEGAAVPGVDYGYTSWVVKKEVALAGGTKEYQPVVDTTELFAKDNQYKVAVTETSFSNKNYTDDDIKAVETSTDGTKTIKRVSVYTETDDKDITLEVMGTTELAVYGLTEPEVITYTGEAADADIKAIEEDIKKANASVELNLRWVYTSRVGDDELAYDKDGNVTFIHAGTYTLLANYRGDTTYKPLADVALAQLIIMPAELKISPKSLGEKVEAQNVYNITLSNNYELEGVVSADKGAFTWKSAWGDSEGNYHAPGFPAFEEDWEGSDDRYVYYYYIPTLRVYDNAGRVVDGSLKGASEYTLSIDDEGWLKPQYDNDYQVTLGSRVIFKTVHGRSTVTASIAINDSYADNTHNITFKEGIPYSDEYKGNYVTVWIDIPTEYEYIIPATAAYENAIKAAGGEDIDAYGNTISARFSAAEKKETAFTIRWTEGHAETFRLRFDLADLEANLREAVAPKSLAFNSPKTKMVAGESQALDVKITKAQNDDIIWLQYKVISGEEYVAVNKNTGEIKALKEGGSATVAVYPVREDENGKAVEIPNAKQATVKITVSKVAAPKITKLVAWDEGLEVQYKYVANSSDNDYGWRREIYVMKGSNVSAATFETAIAGMKRQDWKTAGFARAPIFRSSNQEYDSRLYVNNKWTDTTRCYISGLETGEQYTVYVRNVNSITRYWDGEVYHDIELSYNGAVKGIKTTLPQVKGLEAELVDKELSDESIKIGEDKIDRYVIDLTEGSAAISVVGAFDKRIEDPDADAGDAAIKKPLPLTERDFKAKVAEPKLTYTINRVGSSYNYDEDGEGYYSYYISTAAPYAKVDKKGKITFKQPERILITIRDTVSGEYTRIFIDVTAKADAIAGKTVTMQVGQGIYLEDLVTYKAGRTVLNSNINFDRKIEITDTLKQSFMEAGFELDNYGYLRATREVKSAQSFTLSDQYISGSEAVVKIKVKALDPVKNLSIIDVADKSIKVQFVPNYNAEGYRIDITDARGSLVQSKYVTGYDSTVYINKVRYYLYNISGLTTQCKYNVKVTALFRDQSSKPVTKAVATTKLPASYKDLGLDTKGGMRVTTFEKYDGLSSQTIGSLGFVSGNSYTLIAIPDNMGAQFAVTDNLTWSSSDSKVATVKAIGGSYSATLKAVKSGTTTIEVRSGITKKVIARYDITINTVGKAKDVYYGENESLDRDWPSTSGSGSANGISLNGSVDVSVESGEYELLSFTAPYSGSYVFYSTGSSDTYVWFFNENIGSGCSQDELDKACFTKDDDDWDETGVTSGNNFAKAMYLTSGQTIYIAAAGYALRNADFTVHAEAY